MDIWVIIVSALSVFTLCIIIYLTLWWFIRKQANDIDSVTLVSEENRTSRWSFSDITLSSINLLKNFNCCNRSKNKFEYFVNENDACFHTSQENLLEQGEITFDDSRLCLNENEEVCLSALIVTT